MKAICTLLIFISGMGMINAQKFTNAGEYMGFIQKQYQEISKDTWSYITPGATLALLHTEKAQEKWRNAGWKLLQPPKKH